MSSNTQEIIANAWPSPWFFPIFSIIVGSMSATLGFSIIYTVVTHFRKELHIDLQMGLFMVVFDTLSSLDMLFSGIAQLPVINLLGKNHIICILESASCTITFFTSMLILGVVALERCLLIVYKIKLKDRYYWAMVCVCCLVALSNVIMTTTTDSIELLISGILCYYSNTAYYGKVAHIIMILGSAISFTSLIICYSQIVYNRHITSKREQLALGLDPEKVRREANRTSFKLLAILIINITSNSPYVIAQILILINPNINSPQLSFFTLPFIVLDVWWNSVLYLVLNEKIYRKMKEVFL